MRRELLVLKRTGVACCPAHDKYPADSYTNRRSRRARAQGKKKEHRLVRRAMKQRMQAETGGHPAQAESDSGA